MTIWPTVDELLGGRYRLTGRIASGGMGEVWQARDEVLGRDVAVKILRREYADDPTFRARFRAEARHTAALSHAGIAAVYDFAEGDPDGGPGADGADAAGGSPYLVMEHVPGEPLSAVMAREGPLAPDRTMEIVGQAAHALQAAHDAGVIHRDVKPGNILVTPAGQVKITDFGIARATNAVPLTQTGAIMGTAYYISPEQASGNSVTPASDLYSLGVVAYECLTGQRPFAGDTPVSVALAQVRDTPPELPPTVPAAVRALVMRLLAKEPAERPASAGELGDAAVALAARLRADGTEGPDRTAETPATTRVLPAPDLGSDIGPDAPPAPRPTVGTDTDPGFRLPPPSRLPRWLPYALALAGLALLLLLVAQACGGDPEGRGVAEESPAATAPTTVEVVAADFVGRPVAEAREELEGLGLRVKVVHEAGGGTVGTVKAVAPEGTLAAGDLVTITGVAPPDVREEPGDEGPGGGPGKGSGNGNGKGKGRG